MAEALSGSPGAGFDAFYRDLHGGRAPYRWQVRAAVELATGQLFRRPIEGLSAPTGAGKTSLIECVLFALAWQAAEDRRTTPLRLFWVIDRRGVVDQVFKHAHFICKHLEQSPHDSTAGAVAARLRRYGERHPGNGDVPAVQVQRWRGGIERDVAPLSPSSPAVVCTTVDQVGSRLLFRGYGTSRRSRPIDAALVGTDSLIVLDEAHISGPFMSTARDVAVAQERAEEVPPRPLRVAAISATLGGQERPNFQLTPSELGESALARRLRARKRARLVTARTRVRGLVDEAGKIARLGFVVGVVANTVGEARRVHSALAKRAEALLIIGPSRPLERDAVLSRIPERRQRGSRSQPLFVVATQAIEVGLELDFDALVTAAAPFPSLVQRFGRLDRAGDLGESEAAIVGSQEPCPVYGTVCGETFEWLAANAEDSIVDLGPASAGELASREPPSAARGPLAPLLAPWHVEALAQTSVDPIPSPDVAPFLHGEAALEAADVRIAWRADLVTGDEGNWAERVRVCPPHTRELLSLGVGAVKRWFARLGLEGDAGGAAADLGDVESAGPRPETADQVKRAYVRVPPPGPDGARSAEFSDDARSIRPGDVIVVPSSYGGCDPFGWDPESTETVHDLSDLHPYRPRLLIDKTRGAEDTLLGPARELAEALAAEAIDPGEAYAEIVSSARQWIRSAAARESGQAGGAYTTALEKLAEQLLDSGRAQPVPADVPTGLLLEPASEHQRQSGPQRYEDHVRHVEELARSYAVAAGFDDSTVETVAFAARFHDAGKLDPRFQAWLNGGSPGDPLRPLAKSGRNPWSARSQRDRIAAGWPRGKRHEALSAALVAARKAAFDNGVDRELALHLMATHHGQHRPFLPPEREHDANPVVVAADIDGERVEVASDAEIPWAEQAERFCELNRRYGPWGLAALEATLVLADRRASEDPGA